MCKPILYSDTSDMSKLYSRSDPTSSSYGKHWSSDQVAKTFAPSDEAFNATLTWLAASGFGDHRIGQSKNSGFLTFDATVGELEELLKTEYHQYTNPSIGDAVIACDQSVTLTTRYGNICDC